MQGARLGDGAMDSQMTPREQENIYASRQVGSDPSTCRQSRSEKAINQTYGGHQSPELPSLPATVAHLASLSKGSSCVRAVVQVLPSQHSSGSTVGDIVSGSTIISLRQSARVRVNDPSVIPPRLSRPAVGARQFPCPRLRLRLFAQGTRDTQVEPSAMKRGIR